MYLPNPPSNHSPALSCHSQAISNPNSTQNYMMLSQQQHYCCHQRHLYQHQHDHYQCSEAGLQYKINHQYYSSPCQSIPPYQQETCQTLPTQLAVAIEPPHWAVSARGEAYLQPVCETRHKHKTVDLTRRNFFRIGRSPSSDIPLFHSMSSRRHAILFHHPCGTCYISDCYSAHGTYVDGVRVPPFPHPPRKVRRGALIRFGDLGAPTFIMKSFSSGLNDVIQDLNRIASSFSKECENDDSVLPTFLLDAKDMRYINRDPEEEPHYFRHPQHWINYSRHIMSKKAMGPFSEHNRHNMPSFIRGDGGGVVCISDGEDAPMAALILLNTRLNSVGQIGSNSSRKNSTIVEATKRFSSLTNLPAETPDSFKFGKRHLMDVDIHSSSQSQTKRLKPLLVASDHKVLVRSSINFLNSRSKPNCCQKRVKFSDERSTSCYPASVTPEELSSDEERDLSDSDDRVSKKNTMRNMLLAISYEGNVP